MSDDVDSKEYAALVRRLREVEAENERLRDGLSIARRHVVDAKEHADDESISPVWQAQCHADMEFIDKALETQPTLNATELLTGHGDQRPKRGGWAPGFYANTCQSCGRSFVGDKWAWVCADCAYKNE